MPNAHNSPTNAQVSGFVIYEHWHQHNAEGITRCDQISQLCLARIGDHRLR